MESPFWARSNMGTRRSTSEFLPWVIYGWVCALMILSIISACLWSSSDYRMVVTWSIELLLWLVPYTFEKTTNLGSFWAFFVTCRQSTPQFFGPTRTLAICCFGAIFNLRTVRFLTPNGPPLSQESYTEPSRNLCVSPLWTTDSPRVLGGQSAVEFPRLTQNHPETPSFQFLTGGKSTFLGRTVRRWWTRDPTELHHLCVNILPWPPDGPLGPSGQSAYP